jgi:D-alanyl-D-alanine carboxypeptidase
MKKHAKRDSVDLHFVSAFRSFDDQKKIIQRKLNRGYSIKKILRENKLPGYSEHHTGKAIDITSKKLNGLFVSFEDTREFKWLVKNAATYNFYLSYPKDNNEGIMYEPWHWMFKNND